MSDQISQLIDELGQSPSPKEVIEQLDSLTIDQHGIATKDLTKLIDLVTDTRTNLTTGMKNHVIRHFLFFKGKVPTEAVYNIIGSLGTKTPVNPDRRLSPNLQISLVNWLICVHAYLQDPEIIERLYGLLFNYLEYEYLRSPIAQLLLITTKSKHVNETRVNHLINMYNKDTLSEPIIALAVQYQEFKPELMLNVFPKTTKKFRLPNMEYVERLRDLNGSLQVISSITELRELDEFGKKLKKRRVGAISLDYTTAFNITHEQDVSTVEDLVSRIESLTIPKDWDTIFTDHTGISLLTFVLKGNELDKQRFDAWIKMSLDGLHKMRYNEQKKILEMLVQYVELTDDVSPFLIEDFLASEEILTNFPELSTYLWFFLSKLKTTHVDELKIINELYNGLLLKMPVDWCCDYLETMGALLKTSYNTPDLSDTTRAKLSTLFKNTLRHVPTKLKTTRQNRSLGLAVTRFVSKLQSFPEPLLEVQDVALPPTLMYSLLFSDDPVIFSAICEHLNFAKSIIKNGESTREIIELTNLHNSYVVDVCNLTWRNKAFDTIKTSPFTFGLSSEFINSFATTLPIFDRNSNFKSLFNIHHAPTFAAYSAKIIRSLEDRDTECTTRHEGPLTTTSMQELIDDPDSKWLKLDPEGVKVEVLKELENLGYVGLAELLFSHLKSLANKR